MLKEYEKVVDEYYSITNHTYYRKNYFFYKPFEDSYISIYIAQVGYNYKIITISTKNATTEIFNRLVKYFIGNTNGAYIKIDENENYRYIDKAIFTH